MNKKMLKGMLCLAAVAALSGCADDFGHDMGGDGSQGAISLTTKVDRSLQNTRSRVEYDDITVSDLSLRLTADESGQTHFWESVDAFPAEEKFNVGMYTMEVFYGDEDAEGFESPYYYGQAKVKVEDGKTSQVSVTASLANALLDIAYTENFTNYMSSYSAEVHSAGGQFTDYGADETRPVYTKTGTVDVNVSFTKPNGMSAKLSAATFEAQARHFYHVTVDVTNEGGDASLVVKFDDGLDEQETTLDISDEVLNAPAPEVTPEGFESGTAIELVEGTMPSEETIFNVAALGGLKKLTLTTNSASLKKQGWPDEIDLIANDIQHLTAMGLKARGVAKPDTLALVNLTEVIPNIAYVEGGNNTNEFTLVATDRYGKVSETKTLVIETKALSMRITDAQYYLGDNYITYTIKYSGGNPEEIVTEYQNSRGTWTAFVPTSMQSPAEDMLTFTAAIESQNEAFVIRARVQGLPESKFTVTPLPQVIYDRSRSELLNVFTNLAYIPVTEGDIDNVTVYVLGSEGQYTAVSHEIVSGADKLIKVSGLSAGSANTVKIVNDGKTIENSPSVTVESEALNQIPDSGFDTWTSTRINTYKYLWMVNDGSVWQTLNSTTCTSDGASYSYVGTSGTIPANGRSRYSHGNGGTTLSPKSEGHTAGVAEIADFTNQKSGNNAAIVRTVGWGEGNSAVGSSNSARCKNQTAGQLFISDYPFESRPASMTFWYHYDVKKSGNGDKGQAKITIKAEDGSVISEQTAELPETSSDYQMVTLELSYDYQSKKAAYIDIQFISTIVDDALNNFKNSDFWDYPRLSNLSGGEYVGSELYIDDVVLNY